MFFSEQTSTSWAYQLRNQPANRLYVLFLFSLMFTWNLLVDIDLCIVETINKLVHELRELASLLA